MVLEVLHHHTAEDDTIWPILVARVPAATADLEVLEADPGSTRWSWPAICTIAR